MKKERRVFRIILAAGLVLGLAAGTALSGSGVDGESDDADHKEWTDVKPNPMERPVDTSEPAMKPGKLLLPAEKAGTSEPAMRPGSMQLPAVQQGSSVAFTDTKTQGGTVPAAGQGSSVGFTDTGTQGVSMGPGSSVGFTDAGTQGTSGSGVPGQMQIPGRMR